MTNFNAKMLKAKAYAKTTIKRSREWIISPSTEDSCIGYYSTNKFYLVSFYSTLHQAAMTSKSYIDVNDVLWYLEKLSQHSMPPPKKNDSKIRKELNM